MGMKIDLITMVTHVNSEYFITGINQNLLEYVF